MSSFSEPSTAEQFRAEVRAFIAQALPDDLRVRVERGAGLIGKEDFLFWQRKLFERGWGAPGWPIEHGGTGWTVEQRQIYEDESGRACVPRTTPQGIKMIGPILCAFGTPAQQRKFLAPILRGEVWWCQGYSEPGAGSDLAAVSTRAVREGDFYRVSGQKVWTTYAHWSDWMFCLVRTDASGKRQEGITFLLIDMKSKGVSVRPIVTIDDAHHTNEVFLDDVLVPVENRIGDEGQGWTCAKALLAHERAGIAELGRSRERLARLKGIIRNGAVSGRFLAQDEAFRMKVAQVESDIVAAEASTLRLLGGAPGGDSLASILKLTGSNISQELSRLLVDVLGPHALRDDHELAARSPTAGDPLPSPAIGRMTEYLTWRAHTIAGGSSEIQKNIIAKMAFGD